MWRRFCKTSVPANRTLKNSTLKENPMITIKRTWWTPHEGPVDLPSNYYLPGVEGYVTITRNRHVITQNEKLRGVPLVSLTGTYSPRKTRCPSLKKRFEDDGLVPLFRPLPYKALLRKNMRRRPKPLPPMTIRIELFPPVKMAKRKVTYVHRPSGEVTFCHQ